jgi:uncharacterized membrane-anchored protein YhcB (DUF1043 family)
VRIYDGGFAGESVKFDQKIDILKTSGDCAARLGSKSSSDSQFVKLQFDAVKNSFDISSYKFSNKPAWLRDAEIFSKYVPNFQKLQCDVDPGFRATLVPSCKSQQGTSQSPAPNDRQANAPEQQETPQEKNDDSSTIAR